MDQEWAEELREIRRMVEFLVHRERKLDVKRAPSSKTRSSKPTSKKALMDRTKVVKLTVDKWCVVKGFRLW